MKFPIINTIDDVIPHIKDNPNFIIKPKADYFVIDYLLNTPDMFNNPYQKECRGLLFYENGRIMARRLHKFFNLNERPESNINNINLDDDKKWFVLEKLDGSLITPMFTEGKLTWGSMAGVTFLTPQIEEFVSNNPQYNLFAYNYMQKGLTCIFEWCSNKNRIVISYPKDRLVLTAIRDTISGEYLTYEDICDGANLYNIDVVKKYPANVNSITELASQIYSLKGVEGIVLRSNEGEMVKIKAEEYCLFHKTKENISSEKNVVNIIASKSSDDIKSLLMDEDKQKLINFENLFWLNIKLTCNEIFSLCVENNFNTITRKDFALNKMKNLKPYYSKFIFEFFDKESITYECIFQSVLNFIVKHTNTQTKLDETRTLWDRERNFQWNS